MMGNWIKALAIATAIPAVMAAFLAVIIYLAERYGIVVAVTLEIVALIAFGTVVIKKALG